MPRARRITGHPTAPESPDACGVMEQPLGYRCNLKAGHRVSHTCKDGKGRVMAKWSRTAEYHGPVLHGVEGPKSPRTLCGERAGTREHPITYEARDIRCAACLATLTPSEKVIPARRGR